MDTIVGDCPLGAKCETPGKHEGKDVIVRCPWYTKVRGRDVNTGEEVDNWGCAIAWTPSLLINAANESRKNVAATESFRNVMAEESEKTRKILSLVPNDKLTIVNKDG